MPVAYQAAGIFFRGSAPDTNAGSPGHQRREPRRPAV